MAKHTNLTSLFTAIADAIRAKKGTTDAIVADNFPDEIAGIEGGGGVKAYYAENVHADSVDGVCQFTFTPDFSINKETEGLISLAIVFEGTSPLTKSIYSFIYVDASDKLTVMHTDASRRLGFRQVNKSSLSADNVFLTATFTDDGIPSVKIGAYTTTGALYEGYDADIGTYKITAVFGPI